MIVWESIKVSNHSLLNICIIIIHTEQQSAECCTLYRFWKGHKNKQELLRGDAQIPFLFLVITPKRDADTERGTKSNLDAIRFPKCRTLLWISSQTTVKWVKYTQQWIVQCVVRFVGQLVRKHRQRIHNKKHFKCYLFFFLQENIVWMSTCLKKETKHTQCHSEGDGDTEEALKNHISPRNY